MLDSEGFASAVMETYMRETARLIRCYLCLKSPNVCGFLRRLKRLLAVLHTLDENQRPIATGVFRCFLMRPILQQPAASGGEFFTIVA